MKTVALLLSALNIKTFLCQYLDCEYFKNETSNLVMCSCQVKNSDLDQNNTTTGNVSVSVFCPMTNFASDQMYIMVKLSQYIYSFSDG